MRKVLFIAVLAVAFYSGACGGGGENPNVTDPGFDDLNGPGDDGLLGSYAYQQDDGFGDSFCHSTCSLVGLASPIRVFIDETNRTVEVQDTSGNVLFSGQYYSDGSFDFQIEFQTADEPPTTDTLICTAVDTFECSKPLIKAGCSSQTTGACFLFYWEL